MAAFAAEAVGAIAAGEQVIAVAAENRGGNGYAIAEADLVVAAKALDVDALDRVEGHGEF